MSLETQAQRFIEVLKELDGSAGNQRMRSELGWRESTYIRVKDHLLVEGRILPGRGRGGSVSLAHAKAGKVADSAIETVLRAVPMDVSSRKAYVAYTRPPVTREDRATMANTGTTGSWRSWNSY
jgi:type I restriction enzyme M protein